MKSWWKYSKDSTVPPVEKSVFTLDRYGGLVVNKKVIIKSGIMQRQIDAANLLFKQHQNTNRAVLINLSTEMERLKEMGIIDKSSLRGVITKAEKESAAKSIVENIQCPKEQITEAIEVLASQAP